MRLGSHRRHRKACFLSAAVGSLLSVSRTEVLPARVSRPFVDQILKLRWPATIDTGTQVSETNFTRMASRRQIAKDWGVAKSYVDKCVTQRDCPTSCLEEARRWRKENTYRRAPTNQKSLARVLAKEGDTNSPEDSTLIPLATAKDIAFRSYDFILDLVDRLPKTAAAQCNPSNPKAALAVLEAACTGILCEAYEIYAAWSKVGPHISTATDAE